MLPMAVTSPQGKKGELNMQKNLLKSYIVRYDGNQEVLAEAMGLSRQRLSAKINENRGSFNVKEMAFIKDRYSLSDADFVSIFFGHEVS